VTDYLTQDSVASGIGIFLIIVLSVGLYFLPTIIGFARKVPNIGSVGVINFFLGWSLIGWVVALAMAVRSVPGSGTTVRTSR